MWRPTAPEVSNHFTVVVLIRAFCTNQSCAVARSVIPEEEVVSDCKTCCFELTCPKQLGTVRQSKIVFNTFELPGWGKTVGLTNGGVCFEDFIIIIIFGGWR